MKVSNHATHCIKCNGILSGNQIKFCSTSCKGKSHQYNSYKAQQTRGLKRKIELIKQFDGQCSKCGYNKNSSALEFHHIDPSDKSFPLDLRNLSNRAMSAIELEVAKCILICSNCHRELHNPHLLIP